MATPGGADVSISERGLSTFLDPSMSGVRRFIQVIGYPFGLLTPQMSGRLVEAATAGSRLLVLSGTTLSAWLQAGVILALEQQEQNVVVGTSVRNGNLVVELANRIQTGHGAGSLVTIDQFPVLTVDDIAAGAGAPSREAVRLSSPFLVVVGDTLILSQMAFKIDRVDDLGGGVYAVGVDDFRGVPDVLTGTTCFINARPVYQSDLLTMPDLQASSLTRGPFVVDCVGGAMVTDATLESSSIQLFIEEADQSSRVIAPFREVARNTTLTRHPITTDQLLFWRAVEGSLDWNGTNTLFRGHDNGRVHLWTACRPTLDAAAPIRGQYSVPSFAPYRVLLNNSILPVLEVRRLDDNQIIPASSYTVDTTNGYVDFDSSFASTGVFIVSRPRLSWQTVVTPSEAGLEMSVRLGDEEPLVFLLGAAGVQQVLNLAVLTSETINQIHIAVRRADDSPGPFTVAIGDLSPRGRRTAALRYIIATDAIVDYEWSSSGLILKPMWHNIDLLRARLDDSVPQSLNNGRLLL